MYHYLLTTAIFIICSYTDIRYKKVYKIITAVYFILALSGHLIGKTGTVVTMMTGLIPGAFCLFLSWASRQEFGYGDSTLIAICGVSLGFRPCMTIIFTAFFCSGVWALVLFGLRRADRKSEIPFVPFLLLGTVIQGIGGL